MKTWFLGVRQKKKNIPKPKLSCQLTPFRSSNNITADHHRTSQPPTFEENWDLSLKSEFHLVNQWSVGVCRNGVRGHPELRPNCWRSSYRLLTAPFNTMRELKLAKLNRQMRFSLPSIKWSSAPPSFRLLPSTVTLSELCSTIWLPHARQSVVGSWEESSKTWLTVAKNAFVAWALNVGVRMLLKGVVNITSLTAHVDELRVLMRDSNIDILAINKSKLDSTID